MRPESFARALRTGALVSLALMISCSRDPTSDPEYVRACEGQPLRTPEARQAAKERGYAINPRFDCVDRESYAEVDKANRMVAQMLREAEEARKASRFAGPANSLNAARVGFQTKMGVPSAQQLPLPEPPAHLFVRSDYTSGSLGKFAAWVSPDPADGQRHPAIVWLTGGDTNSLQDFWTEGSPQNDQSASAYRKAGIIMMFPTLRGGNTNPGAREYFLGEVEDVLAAAEHLARLPYVDPQRIYLGGHSTGGTLALLTAESSGRFAAVFVFGAVMDVTRYPASIVPLTFPQQTSDERSLRSPINWIAGIVSPVYLIEGAEPPGNLEDLDEMCVTRKPELHCVSVPGADHFSVLDAASKKIAARIVAGVAEGEPLVRQKEFPR